jgi:hypothetical protein
MSKVDSRNPANLDSDDTCYIGQRTSYVSVYHTQKNCPDVKNMKNGIKTKEWAITKRMSLSWCERCQRLVGKEQ